MGYSDLQSPGVGASGLARRGVSGRCPDGKVWLIFRSAAILLLLAGLFFVLAPAQPVRADETVVYAEGFENDNGGYAVDGSASWEWGAPSVVGPAACHSGSKCWGTDLDGSLQSVEGNIYSPAISIPALQPGQVARVRFYGYLDIYPMRSRGEFFVSSDGQNWKSLAALFQQMAGGWQRYEFDVSSYAGKDIYLRFRAFMESGYGAYPGFYIDDVAVTLYDRLGDPKTFTLEGWEDPASGASCPWVYPWNGTKYVQDNDIYSVARYPEGEFTDRYLLQQPLKEQDGQYRLQIREVETEDSWTDLAGLVAVDHANDVAVAPDEKGNVVAYRPGSLLAPTSAVSSAGANELGAVSSQDNQGFQAYSGDAVNLDFAGADVSEGARLLLRVKGFNMGEGDPKPYVGAPAVVVQVLGADGAWREAGRLNPRFEWSEAAFDLSSLLPDAEGEVRVRLLSISHDVKYHEIDYVALDTGPQPAVEIHDLPLVSASSGGRDVLDLLSKADNDYVALTSGNQIDLAFAGAPQSLPGREFIFVSKGYYIPRSDTFYVYTWDGSQWALRDGFSYPSNIGVDYTKSFDLSLFLPDPDGEYKVRVWQDYKYETAAIDHVEMQVGAQTGTLASAVDLRNSSSILPQVQASDDVRINYSSGTRNRWSEYKWTGLPVNRPPAAPAGQLPECSGDQISWTYYDAEGDPQAAAEVEVWTGASGTGDIMWDPAVITGTATSVTYAGQPLVDGESFYCRVKFSDGNGWGPWNESGFVANDNQTPQAVDDTASLEEDSSTMIAVLANDSDPDGDPLSLASVTQPAHGTATINEDGTIGYLPAADYNGADSFTYTISDGQGGSATATVRLTILAVEDAPVLQDAQLSLAEDGSLEMAAPGVLRNARDADGDPLTAVLDSGPITGTLTLNADGSFRYVPPADFAGTVTFTYHANDGQQDSRTATLTILVTQVNDAPVAVDDTGTTAEDTALSLNVLLNDSDIEGDPLSVVSLSQPAHGTATINGDGTIRYLPAADSNGSDRLSYTISDGQGGTASATVNIVVTPVNDAPQLEPDTATTDEDTSVTVQVLANDRDADGDRLTTTAAGPARYGTATVQADGTVRYVPQANFHGSDRFMYSVSDGQAVSTASVDVTVRAVNDAPVAVDDAATTPAGVAVEISVLANDTDIDGDTLAIEGTTVPGHGSVAALQGGSLRYTPAAGFHGTDRFSYTVSDGNGGTAQGNVAVVVGRAEGAVEATDDVATTLEDVERTIAVLANDRSSGNQALRLLNVSHPGHGTARIDGSQVIYTPAANFNGTDTFTYSAGDGAQGLDSATVTVNVTAVNDAPDAVDDASTTAEATSAEVSVLANDTDVDGDSLAIAAFTQGRHGLVRLGNDGKLVYLPARDFNGSDRFTYTVSDGHGGTDTATVQVTVTAVNEAPSAVEDAAETNEDTSVTIAVLSNDTDPDGDSLSISSFTQGSYGSVTEEADHTLRYTPVHDFNGQDSFMYVISDGHGGTDVASVVVGIRPGADAPLGVADAALTGSGQPVDILVLANDLGRDGRNPEIDRLGRPGNGTAGFDPDGGVRYTPAPGFSGTDTFTYTLASTASAPAGSVSLAASQEALDPVLVTVMVGDPAPGETSDTIVTTEDTPVSVPMPTGSILGVTRGQGEVQIAADGLSVTYAPASNVSGTDVFTCTLRNGEAITIHRVDVTIQPVNDAPDAVDDTTTAAEESAVTLDVLTNDVDADGDHLTLVPGSVTQGRFGAVQVTADSKLTYQPQPNFAGTDKFTYAVEDGQGGSDVAVVKVTITPVNDPPEAAADQALTRAGTPIELDLLANDSDVDGDALLLTSYTQPEHGRVTDACPGRVTYTPTAGYEGSDSFTYTISDGQGGTDTSSVAVMILPRTPTRIHLPLIAMQPFQPQGVDLVVERVTATAGGLEIVITNQGTEAVNDEFWVDAYVNPVQAPDAVNEPWQQLAEQGITWGVTADALPALVPGGSLVLTVGDAHYWSDLSHVAWPLPAGTVVYVQVDSANAGTSYGAVLEGHEQNGGAYNNIFGPVTLPTSVAALRGQSPDVRSLSESGLPERPER